MIRKLQQLAAVLAVSTGAGLLVSKQVPWPWNFIVFLGFLCLGVLYMLGRGSR